MILSASTARPYPGNNLDDPHVKAAAVSWRRALTHGLTLGREFGETWPSRDPCGAAAQCRQVHGAWCPT